MCSCLSSASRANTPRPDLLNEIWPAKWIGASDSSESDYGVYYFRKALELETIPDEFLVHVSADCRYKLYVNGSLVSLGPAAGDFFNWNYETLDLAASLRNGSNQVAALVWNEGEHRPESQISFQTGFILQGDGPLESVLNTGRDWKALRSDAHSPLLGIGHDGYYVAGPGELRDMRRYPQGWLYSDFDDSEWANAECLPASGPPGGKPKGVRMGSEWSFIPSRIPAMERRAQTFSTVRRSKGVRGSESWLRDGGSLRIEPNGTATILLDQGYLTNAYPKFEFSGGSDAAINLTYAETLFEEIPKLGAPRKGNRDEVEGKIIVGRRDRVISNGEDGQRFEPLSWRTFRYVELKIETKEDALVLDRVASIFVGYPFELESRFDAGREDLDQMLEVGWRTVRLCAMETYMDCPYYEQLQYIGDTRIQAMLSYYNTGDDRLARYAMDLMDQSRIAEGVTLSRHPSKTPQIISTFSLWYIGMLHDYWMYGADEGFVRDKLESVRSVLSFFSKYQGADGRLVKPPYWLFSDWVSDREGWKFGAAPIGESGESAVLDLTLLWAYQLAAEMEAELGMPAFSKMYAERANILKGAIREHYWNAERGVIFDTVSGTTVSQHANALAILTDTLSEVEAVELAPRLRAGHGMAKATIYFKYYLHLALTKAGLGNEYLSWLDKWRENLKLGLTTWAEMSEVETSRSDCHAWGSSPNIEFYRIILGIDSAAAGWRKVRIEPHLGKLEYANGRIPHPLGEVKVSYAKLDGRWAIRVNIPKGVDGEFVWDGKVYPLESGANELAL